MAINLSHILAGSLDTAIASASLNALANAAYAIGAAINNTPTSGATVSYDLGDLTIQLSSAVTTGTGQPYLNVYELPAVDGTNYASPNAASAPPPSLLVGTFWAPASTSIQTIVVPDLRLLPYNIKFLIQNNLGVAFPATNTSTCQLQRRTVQFW
jgi:hypothetical protein